MLSLGFFPPQDQHIALVQTHLGYGLLTLLGNTIIYFYASLFLTRQIFWLCNWVLEVVWAYLVNNYI